jgi:hypothetical protein
MNALKIVILIAVIFLAFFVSLSPDISFKQQVLPIFETACADCHSATGEGTVRSGLILDSYASLMQGTKHGPVIVAGSAASSTLFLAINHQLDSSIQMPPHHETSLAAGKSVSLTDDQIEIIKEWIEQGAEDN